MTTTFATSFDGLSWRIHGDVLRPTPSTWDARGARMTAILSEQPFIAFYDGRAAAGENWHERTGVALDVGSGLAPASSGPVAESPWGDHALRYVSAVQHEGRIRRYYFEACRPDGAHELYAQEVG